MGGYMKQLVGGWAKVMGVYVCAHAFLERMCTSKQAIKQVGCCREQVVGAATAEPVCRQWLL